MARAFDTGTGIEDFVRVVASELEIEPEEIDRERSLVELGIDSLAAVRIAFRLEEELHLRIEPAALLEAIRLGDFTASALAVPTPVRSSGWSQLPLSHAQRALWFLDRIAPTSSAYLISRAVRMAGPLDVQALRNAFQALVDRHEALRTEFPDTDGDPVQRLVEGAVLPFQSLDTAGWSEDELRAHLQVEAERPFSLERAPLMRVQHFQRGPEEHVLLIVVHHIVADLWSFAVLLDEVRRLYLAARNDDALILGAATYQYADFARWQTGLLATGEGDRLKYFWRSQLCGELPVLNLPVDRPRPREQSLRGDTFSLRLAPELSRRLRSLATSEGTTLFATLLAAFFVLLHRHTAQEDILVVSPMAGRTRPEWSGVVGCCTNLTVLRARLSGEIRFTDFLHEIGRTAVEAFAHHDYPFQRLVEDLRQPRDPSRAPLAQAGFVFQQAPLPAMSELTMLALGEAGSRFQLGDLLVESLPLRCRGAQRDLTLTMGDADGRLTAVFEYDSDLCDAAFVGRLAGSFERLLGEICGDPSRSIAEIPVLSAACERRLVEWNDTATPVPGVRIHQLFEAQVAKTPGALAVRASDRSLTYRELNDDAEVIACRLRESGVGPEITVAVALDRSARLISAILGILKSGGAYVPLEPAHPVARIEHQLRQSRAALIVTEERHRSLIASLGIPYVCLDTEPEIFAAPREKPIPSAGSDADLAYVIFTSGSTGVPKGIAVTHRNSVNAIHHALAVLRADELAVTLAAASICWDISTFEIFVPLSAGGTIVVAKDSLALPSLPQANEITLAIAVPGAVKELLRLRALPPSLRTLIITGEAYASDLVDSVYAETAVGRVLNIYAPSETTTYSTLAILERGAVGTPPLGRPIANTRLHVLDAHGQRVPIGVAGELCIAGAGVTRGYVSDAEPTAERFSREAFATDPNERMYTTGDRVRWRGDGQLEFLGRLDDQIKVRGFRIEPAEIEAALRQHPAVQDCVVVAEGETRGDKLLVAYVLPQADRDVDHRELRRFLRGTLPHFMVPAVFVRVSTLPRTATGKVDRRSLPSLRVPGADANDGFVPPRTALENSLARIWARALKVDHIGIHDDFFEFGGDSLRAVRVAAEMSSELDLQVPVGFLIRHTTIAAAIVAFEGLDRQRPTDASRRRGIRPSQTSFMTIDHRSLLPRVLVGELPPIDAAALVYLPWSMLIELGVPAATVVEDWCEGLPVLNGLYETSFGRIGTILLPCFDIELYRDLPRLVRSMVQALYLARSVGARVASLTGLLASATNHARDLVTQIPGDLGITVTTGHATTAAAVVLTIERALAEGGRTLSGERLAVLGLGSIGRSVLRLMLAALPHPHAIMLCDVFQKSAEIASLAGELRSELGFGGSIEVLPSRESVPAAFYDATLIVGATNVAHVLDVDALSPGTVIVDDSAPHCFEPLRAVDRFEREADILFAEGGVLRSPTPLAKTMFVPRPALDALEGGRLPMIDDLDPRDITGCVLASLLSARVEELAPIVGPVGDAASRAQLEALRRLGFEASSLHCEGYALAIAGIERFRSRFGRTG